MKRLVQLGFLLGLVGTIAAAYYAPWFEYTRYRSATSVVANGGRVEQFTVHLPNDRVGAPTETGLGVEGGQAARLQHFKLRDADGRVIGLAARHQLAVADSDETSWLLTIPSRGSIVLAGSGATTESIESVLADRGVTAGQPMEQALSIDLPAQVRSVAVTGEFEGIDFELLETWLVTGVDEDGQIRGTLQLNTVGRQST